MYTVHASLAMQATSISWPDGSPLQYRIDFHSGSVTAGVIVTQRMQYDVWSDTVNVASRMESTGEAWRIHASEGIVRSSTQGGNVRSSAQGAKDDGFVERGLKRAAEGCWLLGSVRICNRHIC